MRDCVNPRSVFMQVVATALIGVAAYGIRSDGFQPAWADWTEPVNLAAINSPFNEQNAVLSREQLTMYFTSNRPGGHGNLDVWVARRPAPDAEWSAPVNLPAPINTANNDLAPHLSSDGHFLFFASDREGGHGSFDIYVSMSAGASGDTQQWDAPANVGPPINTSDTEVAPFWLHGSLFFNRGLQPLQLADIYHAVVDRWGRAVGPVAPVVELNSPRNDSAVTIRRDGRELYLWSQRAGTAGPVDIWTSVRQSAHHPWSTPVNVGSPINTDFADVTPGLSFDGTTMIFGSNRPGGMGGNDLWMSTRTADTH